MRQKKSAKGKKKNTKKRGIETGQCSRKKKCKFSLRNIPTHSTEIKDIQTYNVKAQKVLPKIACGKLPHSHFYASEYCFKST